MTIDDAGELIGGIHTTARETWADLGCGDGTFTLALATSLKRASVIHAMDLDASALRRIPNEYAGTAIVTHTGDFTKPPWPFGRLDGILLANSLHYVRDQQTFIRTCEQEMNHPRRFLIVEYDTDRANTWVPYRSAYVDLNICSETQVTAPSGWALVLESINEHRSTRR